MPTPPPMRHLNSPAEVAKREAGTEGPRTKGASFRHYNAPEEVARRERTGESAAPVAPPRKPVVQPIAAPIDWPPKSLGEPNDAPATDAAELRRTALGAVGRQPQQGELEARVAQLEHFVYALLDSPNEAREWRLQLNNLQAVTEVQGQMAARVKALEQTLDDLSAADDGEGPEVDDGVNQLTPGGDGSSTEGQS